MTLKDLTDRANRGVSAHNKMVDSLEVERIKLSKDVWKYIALQTKEEVEQFLDAAAAAGRFDAISEAQMNVGSVLTGCGPAYVSIFLEAMADGAVACGLPRGKALEYAAQAIAGTAQLYLDSRIHPGEMKDAVCSPGGSTIAGVRALEQHAFRAAVMEAVEASSARGLELGKTKK